MEYGSFFENWIRAQKEKPISKKEEIWQASWFDDLIEKIETNSDIEEFIKEKNQKLYEAYSTEIVTGLEEEKNKIAQNISQLNQDLSTAKDIDKQLEFFTKDTEDLIAKYPPERKKYIQHMLRDYMRTGEFTPQGNKNFFNQLTSPPQGIFNRIKNGGKIKKANQQLETYIEKYQKINLKKQVEDFSKQAKNDEITSVLQRKFEAITELDKEGIHYETENFAKTEDKVQETISIDQKMLQKKTEQIENLKTSFKESNKVSQEDELIRDFATEIREEIRTPKQYISANYLEGIENLPDDEKVMFNLHIKQGKKEAAENILAYNGLSVGKETDQWLIWTEIRHNSDEGFHEVFSPVMTVKEAKEIMPKLVDDFDRADITKGIVVPAKAKDILKSISKEVIPQEDINKELNKIILSASFNKALKDGVIIAEEKKKEILQRLGINSMEELPQSYSTLEELKQEYPKDKYLFSGTMSSDDFCQLSNRIGRNGKVYATPDLQYATIYDGATQLGSGRGVSATGDYYIDTAIGTYKNQNIHVGFINVYEQNPQDKFFCNFGMEDYIRGQKETKELRNYDLYEPSATGKAVILNRQATEARNSLLTKEQAINGYIYRSESLQIDGKEYFRPRYDAETYVTAEKNPLKAKIMHLSYTAENNRVHDIYMPVPKTPDKVTQYILDSRQADMADTFKGATRKDILLRFQKQREELQQGIMPKIREENYISTKQEKLNSGKQIEKDYVKQSTNTNNISESTKQIPDKMNISDEKVDNITIETSPKSSAEQKIIAIKEAADKNAEKMEQKLAAKGGTHTVKLTAQQVAKQKGIIAKAAAANAKFDKAVDKAIDKGAQVLNNTKAGKAYEKAAQAVSKTAAAKTVSKTVEKVTQKVAQTTVGKAVTKTIAKTAGSAVGKSVLKKIPLVSLGAGAYFAWDRIRNGDWKGACGELASGTLGCFPGLGTAASTAIDVGLAAKDISQVVTENNENQSSTQNAAKADLAKKAPKGLSQQIEARVNKENQSKTEKASTKKLTPIQCALVQKQKQNSA